MKYQQPSDLLDNTLGVKQLIVAVNKSDYTEPPYSKDRFEEIQRRPRTPSRGSSLPRLRKKRGPEEKRRGEEKRGEERGRERMTRLVNNTKIVSTLHREQ